MRRTTTNARNSKSQTSRVCLGRTLAIILLGFVSTNSVFAEGLQNSQRQVKVERKPKFISNGPGQKPFNVTRHAVPLREIQRSIPKDAIPALIHPEFISASEVGNLLSPKDRVLGVYLQGDAKAYPVRILNWHELVNDNVGGRPILVSWCPLCGSSVVYDPVIDGKRLRFGVSGLLYQRNLVLYDAETGSLWSQLLSEAVTGPLAGTKLEILPAVNTTWGAWKTAHPDTLVLSFATGYQRNYREDPYADYPLPRNLALLVAIGQSVKIYPFSELKKSHSPLVDQVGGQAIIINYDRTTRTARIEKQPARVTSFVGFLYDLKAFYPHAQIYRRRRP